MYCVSIAAIKINVMYRKIESGICSKCGEFRVIANKSKKLCYICNKKRLSTKNKKKRQYIKVKPRVTGERELFLSIWEKRPHFCVNCGAPLGDEPKTHFFSHIKSKAAFPELRLDENNIELLCLQCHYKRDFGSKEDFEKRKLR